MDKSLNNNEKMKEYEKRNLEINVIYSRIVELKEIFKEGVLLDAEKEFKCQSKKKKKQREMKITLVLNSV
jgi:hypothetical protein